MAKYSSIFCFLFMGFLCIDVSLATKKKVGIYEIRKGDFSVKVTNWGATIISVMVPDSKGNVADVVLGFDSIGEYTNDTFYFGAIVGRVANRIGGARFTLGEVFKLVANEGKNMLHGGHRGFSDVIWTVKEHHNSGPKPYIRLIYNSFDGEQGFPADLCVGVTYTLHGHSKLTVDMEATPMNRPTPVNLAQHTYWNLGGHDSGDILSNFVIIHGSHITPVDDELIPTGKIESVNGTAFDFRSFQRIRSRINELPNGYDINYVLHGPSHDKMRKAVEVLDNKSGRVMKVWTNKPGLQFYTGNMLKDVKGKNGAVYGAHAGLVLETQGFPDAVNHPNFPSQIVCGGAGGMPETVYSHHMLSIEVNKLMINDARKAIIVLPDCYLEEGVMRVNNETVCQTFASLAYFQLKMGEAFYMFLKEECLYLLPCSARD